MYDYGVKGFQQLRTIIKELNMTYGLFLFYKCFLIWVELALDLSALFLYFNIYYVFYKTFAAEGHYVKMKNLLRALWKKT